MDYSLTILTSRPDCQALIEIANAEKDNLAYRKFGLQRQRQAASGNSVEIDADLAAVNAELSALQIILTSVPAGPTYEETVVRLTKAEYKKFLLEQRKVSYGPIAMVQREYDIACIDQAIAETDSFVANVTTRMGELPA